MLTPVRADGRTPDPIDEVISESLRLAIAQDYARYARKPEFCR